MANALCYLWAWVLGLVFLLIAGNDRTLRFHAWQSILTFGIFTLITCWLFLMPPVPSGILYYLAWALWAIVIGFGVFLWILLVFKAFRGHNYRLPVIGGVASNLADRFQWRAIPRQKPAGQITGTPGLKPDGIKRCAICGNDMPENAVFCPRCGGEQLLEVMARIDKLGRALERKQTEDATRLNLTILRKSLDETVKAVTTIGEKRDPYTAGHQRRVTELALAIAREMNLSPERIEGLNVAGMLHDVGKISVPSDILNKPGRLSEGEFMVIKSHPQISYDILKTIDFPWPVAQIAYQHHERIDGSGYPRGLKGKNILLEAKILSVADVVEAIASHRPYRPALGVDVALEEISKNKGRLYDPNVVDACLKLFNEKGFKFE